MNSLDGIPKAGLGSLKPLYSSTDAGSTVGASVAMAISVRQLGLLPCYGVMSLEYICGTRFVVTYFVSYL